jgi:hypothetical protein
MSIDWQWLWSPFSIPIIAIIGGTLYGIFHIVATQWRKVREAEMETALKADLVKQGRSADEIERVLRATARTTSDED